LAGRSARSWRPLADAASKPRDDDDFLTTVMRQAAKSGRDGLIESAVQDVFADLKPHEVRAVRRLLCLGIDGELNERNFREATLKEELIARLRRESADMAATAEVADFIVRVLQARRR